MIHYYHRKKKLIETEKVYGNSALEWAYQNRLGFWLTRHCFSKKWLSKLMGAYESSSFSRKKIQAFIQNYQIKMDEFEPTDYASFNDFFIRKFKSGRRPFSQDETVFSAGAEARYLAHENLSASTSLQVKGTQLGLSALLGDEKLATLFEGGHLLIARLCPVDYHRFHFPVSGELIEQRTLPGSLHSVNPVALSAKPDIFLKNERQLALLRHPYFGLIAMLEVGALGVGKIIQTAYSSQTPLPFSFQKGEEKGYFLFGGSTVIWIFQKNKLRLASDLAEQSSRGVETWIPLGDDLGKSI